MTQNSWSNVDRQVIEKLKIRAQRQGRSLDEEIKIILEEVVADEVLDKDTLLQTQRIEAQERLKQARAKYLPHLQRSPNVEATLGLQPLGQNTARRHPHDVIAAFRQLRQDIDWQGISIRELINEGRRF